MKQKSGPEKVPAEQVVKDIRRQTRRQYSAEEKIRIVLEGLRGEENISELCRREGIAASMYYGWSKEFLEAGKRRLAGDTAPAAEATQTKCEHALGRAAEGLRRLLVSRRQRPGGRVYRAREICAQERPSVLPCRVRPSAVQGSHDADAGEHRGRPPLSATSISASIAACHSGASCSRFGSFVMKVADPAR